MSDSVYDNQIHESNEWLPRWIEVEGNRFNVNYEFRDIKPAWYPANAKCMALWVGVKDSNFETWFTGESLPLAFGRLAEDLSKRLNLGASRYSTEFPISLSKLPLLSHGWVAPPER